MWFLSSIEFLQIDTPNKGITTVPLASGLVEGGGEAGGIYGQVAHVWWINLVYTRRVNIVGSLEDQTNEYE